MTLNCKNSDGDLSFFSKYLIGCDGASSFVRRELDVDLEDFEYNQEWLVCDAHLTKESKYSRKRSYASMRSKKAWNLCTR